MMRLEKIKYRELNARQKEIYNFQKVAGLLADFGFNCIKLADDWQGADFLAYHKDGSETLRVQLKSRLTIAKKYLNKSLYMAFPIHWQWYLVAHDELVEIIRNNSNWLNTPSWREGGAYSARIPGRLLIESIQDYKLMVEA